MSAITCEIIGTGDGEMKKPVKNEGALSKTIASDLVLEIIDNALEIVDDPSEVTIKNIMDQIPMEEYKEQRIKEVPAPKEKSAAALIGTGDQRSNVSLENREPIPYHPPLEKKNRLTDLVKNSKQILAKIMMSDTKHEEKKEEEKKEEEKKEEEKVVEVIDLDCIQISDLPFKTKVKIRPEEVPLPDNDSQDTLTASAEESMDEIGLGTSSEPKKDAAKKLMTFPRASGSRAKMAFAAKCRTLKMGASNLKKKKWDVSEKIVNFFKRKRGSRDERKSNQTTEKSKRDDGFDEVKESFKE